jgi:hypothetical protein
MTEGGSKMAKIRRLTAAQEGEPLVPILNLVCMLIPLLLYGAVFVRYKTLDVSSSGAVGPPPEQLAEALDLTVKITEGGFHLAVNPKYRLPWMNAASRQTSALPDIPRLDGGWDFDALTKRLEEVKRDHDRETKIYMVAEDDIPLDVLIRTMDHARGTDDALFPDVVLTRGIV